MSYQVAFCDDEVYQIKVNNLFLKEIASKKGYDFEYHGFQSGKQLRNYLLSHHVDLLFLDIDLGDETGIEVAAWVAKNYPDMITIFITGHREFAEEAFEVEAAGYLVKPYDIKKMENVVRKAVDLLSKRSVPEMTNEIVITDENVKKKINRRDIFFIQRQQSKSIIQTKDKEYQVYETLTSLCERIGDGFIRVNQGEVVNITMIKEIKGNSVYLKNGMEMSIGRTYRKEVLAKYFGV